MRLGLAVVSAAAVIGGYWLVNSIASRPAPGATPAAQEERGWLPGAIDEPVPEAEVEIRSYELIRYVNPDGSLGMVDDPRRVPPGATITGRERRTVERAKPPADTPPEAPGPPAARTDRRLSGAEQRLVEKVLETGVFPDAVQLEGMQDDLDALERERRAAGAGADGPSAAPR
jgi:hypothetical protein